MASSLDFTQYVIDQIKGVGDITYKRMFGEYGLYCDGKFFGIIHDDCFYVKVTEEGLKLIEKPDLRPPYPGAKNNWMYIENVDAWEMVTRLVKVTVVALPEPKPKSPKKR